MIYKNITEELLPDIWPMVLIITIIVATLRIAYLAKNHKKFSLVTEIFYLIFIIYILCLFRVVTFQDINFGESNFTPFREIFRYDIGSERFIKNVLGNILLFVPFGFFATYIVKNKRISLTFLMTLIVSFTIEGTQYYIGRVFDIDDIILNVIGGMVGFLIYRLFEKIRSNLPRFMKSETFLDIIIIIVIIAIIIYSFNINVLDWFSLIDRW